MSRLAATLAGLALALAWCGAARAQPAPEADPIVGRPIVALDVDAPPGEDVEQLRRVCGLEVGAPYRVVQVRRALKLLYQLGRFETVRVRARPADGGLHLTIELPPEPRLEEVRVLDGDVLDDADLIALLSLRLGQPFDEGALSELEARVQAELSDRGYRSAAVGMAAKEIDPSGGRALLVRMNEGPRTVVRRLVVDGRPRQPLWRVGRALGVSPGDPIDLGEIRASIEGLLREYRREGYLDAAVAEPVVRPVRRPPGAEGAPEADLVLDVQAGPRVAVRFKGNQAIPDRGLRLEAAPLVELGTGPSALTEVTDRILGRYTRRGYWQVRVSVASRVTPSRDNKEILFSIDEGTPAEVGELTFPGSRLDPDALRAKVHDTVARALSSDLGRPGADPEVIGLAFGDRSVDAPRDSPQPDSTAPDPEQVFLPRAYRAAVEGIADLYRADGYHNVEVKEPDVRVRDDGELIDVAIEVKEGLQWRVGALSFSGNHAIPSAELLALSNVEPAARGGAPLAFDRVEQARRAILEAYQDRGYLYVSVFEQLRQVPPRGSLGWDYVSTSTVAPLDVRGVCGRAAADGQDHCDIELRFVVDEGVRVQAGDVIVRGVDKTRRRVVDDEVEIEPGEVLAASDIERTRDNLLRVGVFERVDVRPVDEDRMEGTKNVVVEVKERKSYSLDVGVGASTAEGIRSLVEFRDRNLFGTALRLSLRAKANVFLQPLLLLYDEDVRPAIEQFYDTFNTFERLEYELAFGLASSRVFGLPAGFSAGLDAILLRDYDPAFAENGQRLALVGNYKGFRPVVIGAPRPVTLQLRTSFERSDLLCNDAISGRFALCSPPSDFQPDQAFRLEGSNIYLSVGPRVSWDLRNDPLDPTAGLYAELTTGANVGFDAQSPSYVSVEGRANAYLPLAERLTFAFAVVFGRLFPVSDLDEAEVDIPINRRFFAGGRSTVRGYAERTLIPQDAQIDPATGQVSSAISTGGRSLLALKSELRIVVYGPVALALFYDVGDLWERGVYRFSTEQAWAGGVVRRTVAHGGGLGLRVTTPIGPLALDFAVPFNKRDPIVNDTQLHFSVGAF